MICAYSQPRTEEIQDRQVLDDGKDTFSQSVLGNGVCEDGKDRICYVLDGATNSTLQVANGIPATRLAPTEQDPSTFGRGIDIVVVGLPSTVVHGSQAPNVTRP